MTDKLPNPGSDEAIDMGCTCPVLDNCHGLGFPWGDNPQAFWVATNCPLHGARDDGSV